MSDEFPRRRGRPPAPRGPVFAAAPEVDAETLHSGTGYETSQPVTIASTSDLAAAPETNAPTATWEPIDDATPRDGREISVRYGEEDATVRQVRWKHGRRFSGRRWEAGGAWIPSDGMTPLPATQPAHWLKPPETTESEDAAEEAA